MTTTLERPRVNAGPRQARDFSRWHEKCMEHLLMQSGLTVTYEPLMLGKTPDLLVRPPGNAPFVIECIARLPDPDHADEMERTGCHVCNGNIEDLHTNVYSRLDEKVTKYRDIASKMPYLIALYDGTCLTCLNPLQTALDMTMSPYQPTLERRQDGSVRGRRYNTPWPSGQQIPGALFELYPHLSGLIYSRWPREHHYLPNPNADRQVDPALLPFASVPALPAQYQPQMWRPRPATAADTFHRPPAEWERQLRHTSNGALHQLHAA